ncbi:AlpA family phage regulatory protein [Chitinimonas naiadis]
MTDSGKSRKLIRLPELISRTGLSQSAIYDRLNSKSPRHDPTFPRQLSLGGNSVAWSEEEIDAWIASKAAQRDTVLVEDASQQSDSAANDSKKAEANSPKLSHHSPSPVAPRQGAGNSQKNDIAGAIVQGDAQLQMLMTYLLMPAWTAEFGAQVVSGICPTDGWNLSASTAGTGIDGKELNPGDSRFADARRVLREYEWYEDEIPKQMAPHEFIDWCVDNELNTAWLQAVRAAANGIESGEQVSQPLLLRVLLSKG